MPLHFTAADSRKLIVFDGIDGCGKSTQFRRLCGVLSAEKVRFNALSFPRYDSKSSTLVKMYLGGELGASPADVNAYAASSFYAADRYVSYKTEWGDAPLIITDRYSSANCIHQGAKLTRAERIEYFRWLEHYEFGLLGLPKPTLTLFFEVNPKIAFERIISRGERTDIHERDFTYLCLCDESADDAADYFGWTRIDANKNEDSIAAEVLQIVRNEIGIS